jgi:hypothetical protein
MKSRSIRMAIYAGFTLAASLTGWQALAEPNRVTFPNDAQLGVHYTTVVRGSVREEMFASQEVIDRVKAGEPIPEGAHVTLVIYRNGELADYFVMEKGQDWGADYDDQRQTGDWQFQRYFPDRTIQTSENTGRCQSCHQGRANSEYMFTLDAMKAFDGTVVE